MKKIFSSNLFLTAAVLSILLPNFARADLRRKRQTMPAQRSKKPAGCSAKSLKNPFPNSTPEKSKSRRFAAGQTFSRRGFP